MKILHIGQVREADAWTIRHEPIRSVDLMERAGVACAGRIAGGIRQGERIAVVAGQGNNGGDGLVIARHLALQGHAVSVYVIAMQEKGSPDFETNLGRLSGVERVKLIKMSGSADLPSLEDYGVVIDAIFGSGLTRPVTGFTAEVIGAINRSGGRILAIDLPSGLFADHHTDGTQGAVVAATHTLTLELPKIALLMPCNHRYTGTWEVVPIGLHPGFIAEARTPNHLFTSEDAATLFRPRDRVSHKGAYGHALLMAGSRDKAGAAILAATGALRSGAGLLTVLLPAGAAPALHARLPEAMTLSDRSRKALSRLPDLAPFNAIAIGPGIGTAGSTRKLFHRLLVNARCPLVLDADALNILALHPGWPGKLPKGTILTPHPKEFERLAGRADHDFHRLEMAREFAARHQCRIVLKSAYTAVVGPGGDASFNATGNAGLAKGGSGDTLTGIILGLLARGYPPQDATRMAVYLHGAAANLAAKGMGLDALLASDVAGNLGAAWKELEESSE